MTRWEVTFRPVDVVIAPGTRSLDAMAQGDKGDLSPLAFAGALRTALMPAAKSLRCEGSLGIGSPDPDNPTGFRFLGPFVTDTEANPLFPVPRHVLRRKKSDISEILFLKAGAGVIPVDHRFDERLRPCGILSSENREAEYIAGMARRVDVLCMLVEGVMTREETIKTLGYDIPSSSRSDWVREEPRTGHRRNANGTVEKEGGLFSRTALRFREEVTGDRMTGAGYGGYVELTAPLDGKITELQRVRLGGDAHVAALTVRAADSHTDIPEEFRNALAQKLAKTKGVILYLSTPAIFEGGWRPDWSKVLPGWSEKFAAVGRPVPIAGWDYKKWAARPVYRAVPAGSVYFLQWENGELGVDAATEFVNRWMLNESVSEFYGKLGFGITLVGVWNPGPASEGIRRTQEGRG